MSETLFWLKKLDKLFSSHHKWTKGAMFRNNKGEYTDDATCRMCITGGIQRLIDDGISINEQGRVCGLLKQSCFLMSGYDSIIRFNDDPKTKFSDIKKLIKHAIKAAKNNENK